MIEGWAVGWRNRGSIPPPLFQSLGNFVHPTLPVSFERDCKTFRPFYLVSMPGEVKDPPQGNGKNLLWTHRASDLILYDCVNASSVNMFKNRINRYLIR